MHIINQPKAQIAKPSQQQVRGSSREKMEEKMSSSGNPERRHSKLEEALEVKSLRRIISAYQDYPKASEKDVRRYERSFRKLPPEHKALLSHLPLKFHSIRRCISINSFFIQSMLQAFEPPIDMNQDIDIGEDEDWENVSRNNVMRRSEANLKTRNIGSEESASTCRDDGVEVCISPKRKDILVLKENFHESSSECQSATSNNDVNMTASCQDDLIISNGKVDPPPRDWLNPSLQLKVPLGDVEKVRCIIRNIVRDWAPEGQAERDQCYKPILQELDRLFPSRCKSRPPCCLVPGAGLGRLALEISCLGFISQGNEFSYYMMICSNFILNYTEAAGEWTIYPWIHSNCNSLSDKDQLRPVSFPDIHPASAGITEGFSMCGGDFVEVYSDTSQEGSWDAVVTCFFLDTAHNIVEYIEIISRILVDGGVWINLGPLLYHFADAYGQDEMSIEISLEDVKKIAFHYGFQMEVERSIETTYTGNARSMMQNRYFAAFWTMKKQKS